MWTIQEKRLKDELIYQQQRELEPELVGRWASIQHLPISKALLFRIDW